MGRVRPRLTRPRGGHSFFMLLAALGFGLVTAGVGCKAAGDAGGSGGTKGGSGGSSSGSGGASSGSGGSTASGGTAGGASGGTTASGGSTSSGGETTSGGVTSTGGVTTTGGATGSGGTTGTGGAMPPTDGGTTDAACQMASYAFVPMVPTVTLLVDRSGTMFHCLTGDTTAAVCPDLKNTTWSNLKTAIESVMKQLEGQVRFGFATVWGTNPASGGMCPSLQGKATDAVAAGLNNATAIATVYDGLTPAPNSTEVGKKFESPASESIAVAAAGLLADKTPGDKYIIFLTDGQPDYCDDANSLCAPDSVIYQLQTAFTAGIKTIVFGVQTSLFDLAPGVLQAFANAGAGEPTLIPLTGTDPNKLWDQCNSLAPWKADFALTGKAADRGATIGTYSATAGPTKPYAPDATDQAKLATLLGTALAGVKSCTFDLGNINGQSIKVDPTQLGAAHICLGKTCPGTGEIKQDAANGWSMATDTQVILNGTSCATWRMPASNDISFDFPCKSIIFE